MCGWQQCLRVVVAGSVQGGLENIVPVLSRSRQCPIIVLYLVDVVRVRRVVFHGRAVSPGGVTAKSAMQARANTLLVSACTLSRIWKR